jgi:hypothetical protein
MQGKRVLLALAAIAVVALVAGFLIARDSGDEISAADVEALFAEGVTCESQEPDGGEWECVGAGGEATVKVGPEGSYSTRSTALPAPGGCCLEP